MTKHHGYEHELPNGDILIVEATDIRPEVDAAFRQIASDIDRWAREAYACLQQGPARQTPG
jgi:hypothetical protein